MPKVSKITPSKKGGVEFQRQGFRSDGKIPMYIVPEFVLERFYFLVSKIVVSRPLGPYTAAFYCVRMCCEYDVLHLNSSNQNVTESHKISMLSTFFLKIKNLCIIELFF